MNGEIRELFGKLIEKDAKNNTGSLETMKEIWPIVKGKEDPFSVAIRSVIVKGATDIKESAERTLRTHKTLFSDSFPEVTTDDQIIDFLAGCEKQKRLASEILRDSLDD